MSNNNINCAFNLFRSSSNTFNQSSFIFYGDQEILGPEILPLYESPLKFKYRFTGCFALMGTSLVVYFVDADLHPNVVKFVDPIVAITSIVAVIVASVPIIKRSCDILLQTIPDHLVFCYFNFCF